MSKVQGFQNQTTPDRGNKYFFYLFQFIYEDTNFIKSDGINEFKDDLDSLLNDLDFAKKNFNKINSVSTKRNSIEKLIDSLDGEQIVINRCFIS